MTMRHRAWQKIRHKDPSPSDLAERVQRAIDSRRLCSRGERLLVAVSGGVDSMVLLALLHELSGKNKWQLAVAHLNHCLRGKNSDADERFVRRAARRLKLPVVIERTNVLAPSRRQKLSLEMAAREARHDFLARAAAQMHIGKVVLAHHADDQAELLLLRLLRGAGGEGLSGMKWRTPSPFNRQVELIRPLLDEPKAALTDFAAAHSIRFRKDATNECLDILRNRIRGELVPLLRRRYQPGFSSTIRRTGDIIAAESDFVGDVAAQWLKHARGSNARAAAKENQENLQPSELVSNLASVTFSNLHVALQRRCLLLQLRDLGVAADFKLVEQLRKAPNRPIAASPSPRNEAIEGGPGARLSVEPSTNRDTFSVVRTREGLVHRQEKAALSFMAPSYPLDLAEGSGRVDFGRLRLHWRFQNKAGCAGHKPLAGNEFFDAGKVGRIVLLRHWRRGDRFQPIGMPKAVKLQDFFTNQKVPRQRRHEMVLATTHKGEIFWVEGMRISEQFKLTKWTRRRLRWSWEEL